MLRLGIVAAGGIAAAHCRNAVLLGARVVAVADPDGQRAGVLADTHGATAHPSVEAMLEAGGIDAVLVCSPPQHHCAGALAVLDSGLPLYLEKPLARDAADGEAIAAAAERAGALCAVGYQWRALSFLPELRELLAGQAVGLVAARGLGPTRGRDWFVRGATGGGQVLERTSHFLDLTRVLGGEVSWVSASGARVPLAGDDRPADSDIDDVLAVTLGLAGGGLGTVDQAWARRGLGERHAIDVVAEHARLELDLDPVFAVGGAAHGEEVALQAEQPALEASLAVFLDAVTGGDAGRVPCTPLEALATLRVALAVERALASGAREPV